MRKDSLVSTTALVGFIVLFAIMERYFYSIHLVIHSFVDFFAGGRSSAKVGMFLFYTLFLCTLVLLPKLREFFKRFYVRSFWLIVSIGATFAYSLSLLFIFFHQWGFKLREFVVVFNNNEVSSTMLLHNHLMKGVNASLLGLFGKAHQENVDTGLAFIGLLPSPLYLIGAVLFLISTVLFLLKFIELYEAQIKWRNLFIIIYAIISFSLLKNMLDGGILNRETPVALAALILVLLISTKKIKENWWWSLVPILGYAVLVYTLGQVGLIPLEHLYSTIYLTSAFALMIGTMIFWQYGSDSRAKVGVLLIALSLVVLYRPLYNSVKTYFNSRRIISNEGVLVGLYNPPQKGDHNSQVWKLLENVNDLAIYHVVPKQPTRINEILRENKLVGNLLPISLVGVSCEIGDDPTVINFILTSTKPLPSGDGDYKFGRIIKVDELARQNSLHRYKVIIQLPSCAPRPLNIIQEILKQRGLDTFFITNISEKYVPNH